MPDTSRAGSKETDKRCNGQREVGGREWAAAWGETDWWGVRAAYGNACGEALAMASFTFVTL